MTSLKPEQAVKAPWRKLLGKVSNDKRYALERLTEVLMINLMLIILEGEKPDRSFLHTPGENSLESKLTWWNMVLPLTEIRNIARKVGLGVKL